MVSSPHISRIGWAIRTLVPIALTAILLGWIYQKVPVDRLVQALAGADYELFFAALIPFSLLYFALDTKVLQYVIGAFHRPVRYTELLPVRAVDYLVSIVNHRLSQGAMLYYLARQTGVQFLEIGSSILFLDFLQKSHLVFWAAVGMLLVFRELPAPLLYVPVAVILSWTVFLVAVHGNLESVPSWIRPRKWRLLRSFRLAESRHYIVVLSLKAPLILIAVVAHHVAMKAFGIEIGMPRLLATLPIIFLVGALPITVARLGTTQAAWIYFHGDVAEPARLVAYALTAHLTFMLTNALLGAIYWLKAYRELFAKNPADQGLLTRQEVSDTA